MTQYMTVPVRRASLFSDERFTKSSRSLNISLGDLKEQKEEEEKDDSSSSNDSNEETNAIVNISIGGTLFRTYEKTLKCIPRLADLNASSSHYDRNRNEYFYDRNPEIFHCVLDYHRLGEVHIPKTMCAVAVQEELIYWGLNDTCLAKCCKKYFYDSLDEMNTYQVLQKELVDLPNKVYQVESSTSGTMDDLLNWKKNIWQFLNDSDSSLGAKIWDISYLVLTIVSIATFFLETLPSCRTSAHHHGDNDSLLISHKTEHAHNPKISMLMDTHPHIVLNIIDISCLVFFTIEFCLRIYVCPRKLRLMKRAATIIDLLYLIPSWFITLTDWIDDAFWHNSDRMYGFVILQALKVFRVFRIIRFVRHYRGLRMLCLALKASIGELFLLGVFVIFAVTIYASFIYCAELFNANSFDSAFIGLWWALITMTTVGYGDYFPESWPGYIVASLCALTGIILIGMPVPIIASNFHAYYGLRLPDETPGDQKKIKVKPKKKKGTNVHPADRLH